jgi:putative ABC transport system substrate-binding protein
LIRSFCWRQFITLLGGVAVWPLVARAQQVNRTRRVAVLHSLAESDAEAQSWVKAFMQGFKALGWTDGLNVRIEVRWAGGEIRDIERLGKELLDLNPDVVFAVTTPSVNAIRRENQSIPVVFTLVTDPVAQGLVESLVKPGRNITGFTIFEPEIGTKWMQVLKDIAPETKRAAVIFNPDTAPYYRLYMNSIEAAGASFAVKVVEAPVRSRADIEAAISTLAREPAGAVISMSDTFPSVHRDLIIALSERHRLPAVYPFRFQATDGGLISYGIDVSDMHRRAASYVDRILKGEKPADMPVQLPTKYELVINLKTAKALGLTIPLPLLGRADEVIE